MKTKSWIKLILPLLLATQLWAQQGGGGGGGGGTGGGVSSVGSGTGLTGGPITSSGTLSISPTYQLPQGCSSNQLPQWNGSTWVCVTITSGGTVTSITAGTGLTGGTITGSGTIALSSPVSVANGGSGATSLTGPIKGNGTSAFSAALAADIVGLFSTCSGTQYLGADGSCHTASGAGTVTHTAGNLTAGLPMFGNSSADSIVSTAWVDASNPAWGTATNNQTSSAAGNDVALRIQNILNSGLTFSNKIDLSGLPVIIGSNFNPFHGNNLAAELDLGCNQVWVVGSGIYTPQNPHHLHGCATKTAVSVGGTSIAACGPGITVLSGITYSSSGGGTCTITATGFVVNQPTTNLIFNYHHGKFPAGNYFCLICDSGQGSSEGIGWNANAFGSEIDNITFVNSGLSNIIDIYTMNNQERTVYHQLAFQQWGAAFNQGIFLDNAEAPSSSSGTGGAVVDNVVMGPNLAADSASAYGIGVEGAKITIEFTQGSCAALPVAHITSVSSGVIGGYNIDGNGTSGCAATPPTCKIYAAPPTYADIALFPTGYLVSTTCTVTLGGGVVTALAETDSVSWPNGFIGTGLHGLRASTFNGAATGKICSAVWEEGVTASIMDAGNHAEYNSCAIFDLGFGGAFGGILEGITGSQTDTGGMIHLGPGLISGTTTISDVIPSGNVTLITDDVNLVTITTSTCPNGVNSYAPGARLDCGNGLTVFNGITSTGTNAGLMALIGALTNPSLPANSVGLLGPASASFTSYALQLPTASPSNQVLICAPVSGGISSCTWTSAGAGTVTSITVGNLSPLFTSSVGGTSSVPVVTYSLTNAASGAFFGNIGSATGAPTYQTLSAVNPQTATYQVLATDFSAYKTIPVASGTFTITLVASGGTQPPAGQYITVLNYGSGVITIARSGQNINGAAANLTLNAGTAANPTSATITSNGTDYIASVDEDNTGSGTVTSVATTSPLGGGTITTTGTLTCTTCTTNAAAATANHVMVGGGSQAIAAATNTTDDNTTFTTTDASGIKSPVFTATGTTSGFLDLPQGTTSSAVTPCNAATSICLQAPTAVTSQLRTLAGTPATGFSLWTNTAGSMVETISVTSGTLNAGPALLGNTPFAVNSVLASTVANVAGHFTNLQVVTTLGGTCTTVPIFNVFDGTTNVGSTVSASATTQTKGTGTSTAQTLTFAAGDVIGIYISTAGVTCVSDVFTVNAQYSIP